MGTRVRSANNVTGLVGVNAEPPVAAVVAAGIVVVAVVAAAAVAVNGEENPESPAPTGLDGLVGVCGDAGDVAMPAARLEGDRALPPPKVGDKGAGREGDGSRVTFNGLSAAKDLRRWPCVAVTFLRTASCDGLGIKTPSSSPVQKKK